MLPRQATDSDVHALACLSALAFMDDPIETYLYPGRREYPKEFIDAQETLLRDSFNRPCGSAVLVALEPGHEEWKGIPDIVGFCVFTRESRSKRRRRPTKKTKETSMNVIESIPEYDSVPFSMNSDHPMVSVANVKAMSDACKRDDSHHWTEEGFERPRERYELCDLGVHPGFQRKGIGKMMLRWIMDKALDEGVPIHTTASPAGKLLYQSMGFRVVGKWNWCPVPNSAWNVMHWNPPSTQQEGLVKEGAGDSPR